MAPQLSSSLSTARLWFVALAITALAVGCVANPTPHPIGEDGAEQGADALGDSNEAMEPTPGSDRDNDGLTDGLAGGGTDTPNLEADATAPPAAPDDASAGEYADMDDMSDPEAGPHDELDGADGEVTDDIDDDTEEEPGESSSGADGDEDGAPPPEPNQ